MQRFSINLWFDNQAEEAARFYTSVFSNTRLGKIDRYGETGQQVHGHQPGTVMTVDYELEGQSFVALNGGPLFKLSPAISFMVNCASAGEVDALWAELAEGGTTLMPLDEYPFSPRYGWIQDRFGVSWQLILSSGEIRQKIKPVLMFVGKKYGSAEDAIRFYTATFPNSEVGEIFRYGPGHEPDREDAVAYSDFTLDGRLFSAMESAREHHFDFSEAISFIVHCQDQNEVDRYWNALSATPEAEQCGWLKDRYGVSWQIIPTALYDLMRNGSTEQSERVMAALLQMKKLDIASLQRAYEGR